MPPVTARPSALTLARRVTALIPPLSLAAGLLTSPPASAADRSTADAPRTGASTARVARFAYENENNDHKRTLSQALEDAQHFDVISASSGTYEGLVPQMRAVNPGLVVLAYLNGTFAQSTQETAYPSSWYSYDTAGRKIRSRNYGNFLMDPTNAGWRADRVAFCKSLIARTGYQGCLVDMLGNSPIDPGYSTGVAVNVATGKTWTNTTWQDATAALVRQIRSAVPGNVVWGNGYGSGTRYFDPASGPTSKLTAVVDGAVTESWLRGSRDPVTAFRPETSWKQSVDMLVDLGNRGGRSAVMLKLWSGGTRAQKDAYHRYALATFLLASNGSSLFWPSYDEDADAVTPFTYESVKIGTPTRSYAKSGRAYTRTYSNGVVVVNPTSSPVTLSLGGTFLSLQGAQLTRITLPAHSGDVLTKA